MFLSTNKQRNLYHLNESKFEACAEDLKKTYGVNDSTYRSKTRLFQVFIANVTILTESRKTFAKYEF